MTASEVLADLRRQGVTLWADGPDLRFSAPRGVVDAAAVSLLSRHKPELLRLVASPSEAAPEAAPQPPPAALPLRAPAGFSLDDDVLSLAAIPDWVLEDQAPYVRHVSPYKGFLYGRMGLDKTFLRGEGCYLVDADGHRYADCIAQFGAVPFGHDPDPVWDAIVALRRERRPNLVITSISQEAGALAERLLALAPPGLAHAVFSNSGAEAVEAALKLARVATGRTGILSARDGFHGLTLGALSATGRDFFQRGFGAPAAGFNYVPFGDLAAVEAAMAARPGYFAAFIVEPVQGESGILPAPPGYLREAQAICRRHGALLIVDEVQTGLGRTGRLFACEEDGVTPDVMVLAKALGGGLVPVGACLYTREVYRESFDLRHGSTFGGNALACRAAMATLDLLTRDDQALVRHVAAVGRTLRADLDAVQAEFPRLVAAVRGRGLMLGVALDLDQAGRAAGGIISAMQQQGLLLYLVVSYLLNVARIRIAPSFTQGTVLRIEPPLVADEAFCAAVAAGLRRVLAILERGDAGALLAHLIAPGAPIPAEPASPRKAPASPGEAPATAARFAFVVHLLGPSDMHRFDPSFARFTTAQLDGFRRRTAPFVRPFASGALQVRDRAGREAAGELLVIPHTPEELLALPGAEARDLVQRAVDLGAERGAAVIGLGGFSSIVSDGGLALKAPPELRITSGNSLTTWTALAAVERACAARRMPLEGCTVAILGAAGAIGHALARLCPDRAGALLLVGNPRSAQGGLDRLEAIAAACRAASGRPVRATLDLDALAEADVVFTATSAVAPFLRGTQLRRGALICDVSRPKNAMPDLYAERPDLVPVGSGLLRAPAGAALDRLGECGQPDVLVACAAETIVLALSGHRDGHLCGALDLATIEAIGRLATQAGFAVVE
ncbi:aminotransferase class III-fold pyridoxal phosphate-dependent enzyme [Methylobacterium nonmethylotrophicum]|uniref:Aminotransferase class III-fold pyridoxal phosphate-dependent enzyme n=1 Tax=Methylobacterium nonmethylotrophicum TaxID=1141884 RepID=A0A4Z0NRL1_9HYPH|nr:aminotransferase class III-fold pyridoxal phosphate-dependent enzyme [Methylobacterium nonmethylotrophicum]TGD98926.1 aminotransferase class III-fold pyridoxal phosphate-dependent enzyme [Methylobacterium nonmethylotrophicum]